MTDELTPTPPPTPVPAHVEYWAISIFNSRTFWLNAAAGVVTTLSLTEVAVIIPPKFLPLSGAVIAALNMYLRTQTVRPVALIAPGAVKPVAVPKISPPTVPLSD